MSKVVVAKKVEADAFERTALRIPAPMRLADLYPPFDRFMSEAPAMIHSTPSMMSDNERILLFNLAKRYYHGQGRIVDAGIFLGGSTKCFSEGLSANAQMAKILQRWEKPIVSLERAIVSSTMPAFFNRHDIGLDLKAGDSFSELLTTYVDPYRDVVELRVGDITQCGSVSAPIELLFLDVLKAPVIAAYAVRQYFPRLIPGRSLVIQQDYFFEGLPFIKTYQEFFADEFEYIGEVGSSAIFRCRSKVSAEKIETVVAGLPIEDQLRLASIALQRSKDPLRRLMMAMSKTSLIHDLQGKEAARNYLAFVKEDFSAFIHDRMLPRLKGPLMDLERLCGPART